MRNGTFEGEQFIDGKRVRKFLFARVHPILHSAHMVEVHAFDKDHAIARLLEEYPGSRTKEWEFADELKPECFVGVMGEVMYLLPHGVNRLQ